MMPLSDSRPALAINVQSSHDADRLGSNCVTKFRIQKLRIACLLNSLTLIDCLTDDAENVLIECRRCNVDVLLGIVKDAVKSLVGAAVTPTWVFFRGLYAAYRANKLWRHMLKDRITIVMSIFAEEEYRQTEKSGLLGVGDARTLASLEGWFKSIRFKNYEVCYAHQELGTKLNASSLIFIGGPDANKMTRDALGKLCGMLGNFPGNLQDPELRNGEGFDYGVIGFVPNPYNSQKWLLLLFGKTSGYGTWAAAEAVTIRPIPMPTMETRAFAALIRSDVQFDCPQQATLKDIRSITTA